MLAIRLFQIAAIGFGLPGTLGTLYFGGLALYSRWSTVQNSVGQKATGLSSTFPISFLWACFAAWAT